MGSETEPALVIKKFSRVESICFWYSGLVRRDGLSLHGEGEPLLGETKFQSYRGTVGPGDHANRG